MKLSTEHMFLYKWQNLFRYSNAKLLFILNRVFLTCLLMVLLSEMAEGFDSPYTLTFSQQWAVEKPQFCFAVDTEIKSQLILIKYR